MYLLMMTLDDMDWSGWVSMTISHMAHQIAMNIEHHAGQSVKTFDPDYNDSLRLSSRESRFALKPQCDLTMKYNYVCFYIIKTPGLAIFS